VAKGTVKIAEECPVATAILPSFSAEVMTGIPAPIPMDKIVRQVQS